MRRLLTIMTLLLFVLSLTALAQSAEWQPVTGQ